MAVGIPLILGAGIALTWLQPLFAMNIAGPCSALLLCIERMNAMSSTRSASLGKRSG